MSSCTTSHGKLKFRFNMVACCVIIIRSGIDQLHHSLMMETEQACETDLKRKVTLVFREFIITLSCGGFKSFL